MQRYYLTPVLLFALPAISLGGTTTKFVRVETGLYDNASDGFNTFAMRVNADTDWTNADIDINLTSGILNHIPPPGIVVPVSLNGFGDTAVHGPTRALGNLIPGLKARSFISRPYFESPTSFKVSWYTNQTDDIGIFDIAMITISPDANGEIRWRTIAGSEVEEGGFTSGSPSTWKIANGAIVRIPEPSVLMLCSLGMVGLFACRHRKRDGSPS